MRRIAFFFEIIVVFVVVAAVGVIGVVAVVVISIIVVVFTRTSVIGSFRRAWAAVV